MRPNLFHTGSILLLLLSAGCGHDSTAPGQAISVPEGLWSGSGSPGAVLRLAPDQLSGTGARVPSTNISISSAGQLSLVGVAFDQGGTMWVTSEHDSLLLGFAPGDLAESGSKVASTIIGSSSGSLSAPRGLAFDRAHHLWVANRANGTVVRFDPGQLATSGTPTPAVTLHVFNSPSAIAFAADGWLWVGDVEAQLVTGYPRTELIASGDPNSSVVLHASVDLLRHPTGMAFDAAGNLWVANSGNATLTAFTPAQLQPGPNPTPHVVLSANQGSLDIPTGLAFDAEGNLWVADADGALVRFSSADLEVSGAPAPSARLTVPGNPLFWSLAFWPRPAGVPLY